MQRMAPQVVLAHGLEGTGAHVQRDEGPSHAAGVEGRKKGSVEVQARRRRRDRPWLACENALIALTVLPLRSPPDVGWQWHFTMAIEEPKRRGGRGDEPEIALPRDDSQDSATRGDLESRPYGLAGPHLHQCLTLADAAFEQEFHLPASRLHAAQARGDHACH